MTDPSPSVQQIQVSRSAAPIVAPAVFQTLVIAGIAFAADQTVKHESALALVLGAGASVASILWGAWLHVRTWLKLKSLADRVPDAMAVVGKPQ